MSLGKRGLMLLEAIKQITPTSLKRFFQNRRIEYQEPDLTGVLI